MRARNMQTRGLRQRLLTLALVVVCALGMLGLSGCFEVQITGGSANQSTPAATNGNHASNANAGRNTASQQEFYVFRNSSLLRQHYNKHGRDMGFASAEEYEMAASDVALNPNALHKIEKEDGDDVYYLEATNDFVIISTDGYIRTYFRPDSGIRYFNKQ